MRSILLAGLIVGAVGITACAQNRVNVVDAPPKSRDALYVSNRDPLEPSPFVKLPIGSVEPKGWIRHMLIIERDGMSGRLPEISQWCRWEGNAWSPPKARGIAAGKSCPTG